MAKIKFNSYEEALAYVNSLPIQTIIEDFARLLLETKNRAEPIKITDAQFKNYFRIVGMTSDGEVERRGRKKKS